MQSQLRFSEYLIAMKQSKHAVCSENDNGVLRIFGTSKQAYLTHARHNLPSLTK